MLSATVPSFFHPYHGRETLGLILRAVMRVFKEFRYEREIGPESLSDHVLVFRAPVGMRGSNPVFGLPTTTRTFRGARSLVTRPPEAAAPPQASSSQLEGTLLACREGKAARQR
jgi:hypothetical protein